MHPHQCRGCDAERLSPAVLPAIQEEPHAAALSPRDPHPGPGAQSDGGRGGHRALRGALHSGEALHPRTAKSVSLGSQ